MIVNTAMNQNSQIDSHLCDNFYLKRKLDSSTDSSGVECNPAYMQQPKKRHIQNICNSFEDSCEVQYNINNNSFNTDCQHIEFLSYDNNLAPVQTTVYCTDQFDTTWQNSDLLELDHRYNSTNNSNIGEKLQTTPKANSSSSQTDSDFEDKNLSWLFNFKLEELPHLSPEVNRPNSTSTTSTNKPLKSGQSKTGKKVDELIMEITSEIEDSEIIVGENVVVENTPKMPKKPPFTYTELIEYALEDKGELTVSGIYQWISDRFPFYKSNDDRWKNSVRHNLSINPHFRKGVKAPQGAGHLWTISSRDSEENALAWEHKKQRLELFFKMEMSQKRISSPPINNSYDEAAAAAESIVQQLRNESTSPEHNINSCHSPPLTNESSTFNLGLVHEEDLKKAAGEILNGIRRNVEVQSINSVINTYQESLIETGDYLNPINKDDAIIESGLRNRSEIVNDYYVTEIDPIELGINMSNVEEEVLFSDEFNLNYFGITSGSDIMA